MRSGTSRGSAGGGGSSAIGTGGVGESMVAVDLDGSSVKQLLSCSRRAGAVFVMSARASKLLRYESKMSWTKGRIIRCWARRLLLYVQSTSMFPFLEFIWAQLGCSGEGVTLVDAYR